MNAFFKVGSALVLAGALATPAFAASGDAATTTTHDNAATAAPSNGASSAPSAASHGMRVTERMRSDLSKAGFTDIHIMPSSFLVRAKDSSGNPVMMVVNPDSITAITEQGAGANAASTNTKGAAPTPNGSQNAAPGAATKP